MPIPDYQALMAPVLELASHGETSVPLVENEIASRFNLTTEEREKLLESGKQRVLHNRIHWAKFYLTKAGLLESPKRGRFVITAAGRAVLTNPPPNLNTQHLLTIPQFQEFYRSGREDGEAIEPTIEMKSQVAVTATPEEVVETAYGEAQAALRADLLQRILQNSPRFFEKVVVELLVAMGYGGSHRNASEHLGKSGDGGIDGVINEDVLGLDRIYVQAKRYASGSSVGRPEIQGFLGSLVGHGASKGVFVTTSTFSNAATTFASQQFQQRLILIDGQRLTDLMVEHDVGVRSHRVLDFKRPDEDFFSED